VISLETRRRAVRFVARWPLARRIARSIARRLAGRHSVGAIAVVVDGGNVLMVRHSVRRTPWALPGGWVRRREDPSAAVEREVFEETGARVHATHLLDCDLHAVGGHALRYSGLTLAFRCTAERAVDAHPRSVEILDVRWMPTEVALAASNDFERAMIRAALLLPAGRGTG
jgi:8-oxo-dGTP pyrophosphatase MutT (NUDIX family)